MEDRRCLNTKTQSHKGWCPTVRANPSAAPSLASSAANNLCDFVSLCLTSSILNPVHPVTDQHHNNRQQRAREYINHVMIAQIHRRQDYSNSKRQQAPKGLPMKPACIVQHQQSHLGVTAREAIASEPFEAIQCLANALVKEYSRQRFRLRFNYGWQEARTGRRHRDVSEIRQEEAEHYDKDPEMKLFKPTLAP